MNLWVFIADEIMTDCWKSKMKNGQANKVDADFFIFGDEKSLLVNDWHPAWRVCDCAAHNSFSSAAFRCVSTRGVA